MTDHDASTRFETEAEAFLARLSHEELYAFARTCTEKLEEILQQGFAAVNEGSVDVAIKSLQEKLKLMANDTSMMTYVAFTNALDRTLHGGLTARDPMFVKADKPADVLYVVFAGMVCFPKFKKSLASFGHVDQLHLLDPNRS